MFTYKIMEPNELREICRNIPTRKNLVGHAFEGFTLFTQEVLGFVGRAPQVYFTCFQDDNLVGVLKLMRVPKYFHDVWHVALIDVHCDFRRMGIAKHLYVNVNNWVSPKMIIYWTNLTDEGKESKINHVGMNIITNCITFPNAEHFEEAYGYDVM